MLILLQPGKICLSSTKKKKKKVLYLLYLYYTILVSLEFVLTVAVCNVLILS